MRETVKMTLYSKQMKKISFLGKILLLLKKILTFFKWIQGILLIDLLII
jgi:hypothetical protein